MMVQQGGPQMTAWFAKWPRMLGALLVVGIFALGARRMTMHAVKGAEATRKEPIPAPQVDEPHTQTKTETAVFAGGCFWGVQTVFERVKGVTATTAGCSAGPVPAATYHQGATETARHPETVKH